MIDSDGSPIDSDGVPIDTESVLVDSERDLIDSGGCPKDTLRWRKGSGRVFYGLEISYVEVYHVRIE